MRARLRTSGVAFQDAHWCHEIQRDKWRRSEAVHMAAEGGCTAAADRRAVSTATKSRLQTSCKSIGGAMEPKAGVDLQSAYSVVNKFLKGTRRSGCLCEIVPTHASERK